MERPEFSQSNPPTTFHPDVIFGFRAHACYITGCLMLAYWTKRVLIAVEGTNGWLSRHAFFTGFPVFLLCLFWSIVIQLLTYRARQDLPVSRGMIESIGGICLDVMVLVNIATINLTVVASQVVPLLILCTPLAIWQVFAFLTVAPRMLPDFWAESGIAEFGVGTGSTSLGLMFLCRIDPKYETPALRSFAAKQLFSLVVMDGLIAPLMLPLIKSLGNYIVAAIAAAVMILTMALWPYVF